MVVLELASNTGSSRGRSSKTTRFLKAQEAQNGGFGTGQQQGQEFQNHQKSFFKGAGSSKWWLWNWPAARAAAGAGVPKPPKNRFLKAREAQNGGFGTDQQHGQQQGQELQNPTKKSLFKGAGSSKWWFWNWPAARAAAGAGVPKPPKNRFLKAREAQNGGFGTGQQHGQQQGQEFQNHQKIAF